LGGLKTWGKVKGRKKLGRDLLKYGMNWSYKEVVQLSISLNLGLVLISLITMEFDFFFSWFYDLPKKPLKN